MRLKYAGCIFCLKVEGETIEFFDTVESAKAYFSHNYEGLASLIFPITYFGVDKNE